MEAKLYSPYSAKKSRSPQQELERLRKQAQISPAEIEFIKASGFPTYGEILDAGCGPGYYAEYIRHLFPGLNVVGLDSDEYMLEEASYRIPTVLGDVHSLPFEDHRFDGAIVRF